MIYFLQPDTEIRNSQNGPPQARKNMEQSTEKENLSQP
jgi:hypothetical protein